MDDPAVTSSGPPDRHGLAGWISRASASVKCAGGDGLTGMRTKLLRLVSWGAE
ncbi:unnamed protein product, partial [Nesidiocoris tenuis]